MSVFTRDMARMLEAHSGVIVQKLRIILLKVV